MSEPQDRSVVRYDSDGPIATITIDRPERRNALNTSVLAGISECLSSAEADESIAVAVLTGAGDSAFCAGADLGGMSVDFGRKTFVHTDVAEVFRKMRASRLPLVARVNGHALAGGFGLMLACDIVVASAGAEMGTPEVNIGLWPFIVTALVQRDLPRKVALEMMLTGRRMGAEEASRWGIVNRVVPFDRLDDATGETCAGLVSKSPLILALGKCSFYQAMEMSFDPAIEYLAGMLTVCLQSEDTAEGVSAFFQKRPPEWKGR